MICDLCSQNSGVEITWVVADFTAAAAGQVTVAKGQQVELLDCCGGTSEMVLVRVPSDCTEGMVPHIVLKQPPSLKSPQATGKGKHHCGIMYFISTYTIGEVVIWAGYERW